MNKPPISQTLKKSRTNNSQWHEKKNEQQNFSNEKRKERKDHSKQGENREISHQIDKNDQLENKLVAVHERLVNLKIPKGWEMISRMGENVEKTKLIPMKTPLDPDFNQVISSSNCFSAQMFLDFQRSKGRKIGLVIDLTNTHHYYDPSNFESRGIEYKKIPWRTSDVPPNRSAIRRFIKVVVLFAKEHPEEFIAVHCTNGYNLTGFMIVSFLTEVMKYPIATAVREFAKVRPPGIYNKMYLNHLFHTYELKVKQFSSHSFLYPKVPKWEYVNLNNKPKNYQLQNFNNYNFNLNNISPRLSQVNNNTDRDLLNGNGYKIPKCFKQIGARLLSANDQMGLIKFLRNTYPFVDKLTSNSTYLDKNNKEIIKDEEFFVTWKGNSIRCMLLIISTGCFLIDSAFRFYQINITFPTLKQTLVDGELVFERIDNSENEKNENGNENGNENEKYDKENEKENEKEKEKENNRFNDNNLKKNSDIPEFQYVYYVSDVLIFNRTPFWKRPFRIRLGNAQYLINHRLELLSQKQLEEESLQIRFKEWHELKHLRIYCEGFLDNLNHETKGILFMATKHPYTIGYSNYFFKWIPRNLITINFVLRSYSGKDKLSLSLYVNDSGKKEKKISTIIFDNFEDKYTYLNRVIECYWNNQQGKWEIFRIRHDKCKPSSYSYFKKIQKYKKNVISQRELIQFVDSIIENNK
ncbi:mRNA-capping enzyme [Anaeramoeba flamelloides]|uniref:mRNA guanylyltransferase n=1 Tax=Anaeramoeba flamelloides TaxID=1746091 RepID=A0AAV8A3Y3_9EUKA|nr:mRNA-capping enzyme [Anaeramoeba flamelloides]